jgi:hypothetical protein
MPVVAQHVGINRRMQCIVALRLCGKYGGHIKQLGGPADGPEAFLVTNTNDSGPGSFRQAIIDSNAHPATDTIAFAIGSGPQMISPLHVLPDITNPVIIDATTQPGYAGTPLITLSGAINQDTVLFPSPL